MKRVHLICNAHLDPVWLWRWQEGCTEALSTFRTAEAFTEEFPDLQNRQHTDILPYGSDKGTTGRHDRKNLQLLEL